MQFSNTNGYNQEPTQTPRKLQAAQVKRRAGNPRTTQHLEADPDQEVLPTVNRTNGEGELIIK